MKKEKSDTQAASFTTHVKYTNKSPKAIAQKKTLSALLSGRQLSVVELSNELQIPDPRSAIRYLRNAGIPISDFWQKSTLSRYKIYFLHEKGGEK